LFRYFASRAPLKTCKPFLHHAMQKRCNLRINKRKIQAASPTTIPVFQRAVKRFDSMPMTPPPTMTRDAVPLQRKRTVLS
jgi:hypothetical protein